MGTLTAKKGLGKFITLRIILVVAIFVVSLFLFVGIADEIVLEKESGFDTAISNVVNTIDSPGATSFFQTITFFGSSYFLLPAYCVLVLYFLLRRKWKMAIDIATIGGSSAAILRILKSIFQRHRPLDPLIRNVTGFSFPSGHSFTAFTFFGLLIYLFWKLKIHTGWKIGATVFFFLFAASIAFSRVYLRVHYPSDVLAGFCLSFIWLTLSLWMLGLTGKFFKPKIAEMK